MGRIMWIYQTQRLFIICAPDTDVTKNVLVKELFDESQKKFQIG